MTESVDGNTEFTTNDFPSIQSSAPSPSREDFWRHLYYALISIWRRIESLLFYTGVHPSYLVFRVSMAFQLFAGRLSPFLGTSSSKELKKGESGGTSDSDEDNEGIALVSQNRTMPVKRRRAQVSEQSFHGM